MRQKKSALVKAAERLANDRDSAPNRRWRELVDAAVAAADSERLIAELNQLSQERVLALANHAWAMLYEEQFYCLMWYVEPIDGEIFHPACTPADFAVAVFVDAYARSQGLAWDPALKRREQRAVGDRARERIREMRAERYDGRPTVQ